jgi:murein DD-endopeptidase MepM/ murein hydrolase activator NlpD
MGDETLTDAHPRNPRIRATLAAAAAVGACALVSSAPAAAAEGTDVPPASGGTQFYAKPNISRLECATDCASARGSQAGSVSVKEDGILRIRGRNLDSVGKVLFLGSAGRADNVGVVPSAQTPGSLEVKVPRLANDGAIVLLDPAGHSSPPSRSRVRIARPTHPLTAQSLIWPVRGSITGVFGENRGDHIHSGLDIATATGTPIKAAAAGTVVLIGSQGGYGNFTCLRHASLVTCYAHQSAYLTAYGAYVRQGQVIGRVGCTGNCSGPHLHFEVRRGPDPWSTPLDPIAFLPRR